MFSGISSTERLTRLVKFKIGSICILNSAVSSEQISTDSGLTKIAKFGAVDSIISKVFEILKNTLSEPLTLILA